MPTNELISKLNSLGEEFAEALVALSSEHEIREIQARFLGKKGRVSALMGEMGKLAPEDRRTIGAAFNKVKSAIEGSVDGKLSELADRAIAADLARRVDISLPGRKRRAGPLVRQEVSRLQTSVFAKRSQRPSAVKRDHEPELICRGIASR